MMRMRVSSSVPAPFMAAFRRRAKYNCGFLAHLTVEAEADHEIYDDKYDYIPNTELQSTLQHGPRVTGV